MPADDSIPVRDLPPLDPIIRLWRQALGLPQPAWALGPKAAWLPARTRPEHDARWPLPASVALHLGFGGLLLLIGAVHPLTAPKLRSIAVQLVTQQQFVAATKPVQPAAPPSAVAPAQLSTSKALPTQPSVAPPATKTDGMVQSSQYFAAGILSEKANKDIRDTLPLLASDERLVQLCNIEALEQLHVWKASLTPDTLVPYAFADTSVTGLTLKAEGGAIRDRRQWYHFRFSCTAAPDYLSVADFKFALGDLIPQDQWDDHNLTVEEDPQD